MKILFLSDLNSIHTKKWIKSLAEKKCEIIGFGLSKPTDDFYDNLDNVSVKFSDFSNQYGKSSLKKFKYLKVVKQLKKVYNDFKPDIVHAHYATSYGLLGTFLKHTPYLISVWGEDVFSFPRESWIKNKIFKKNLAKADYIYSTSKVMAIEAEKYTFKKIEVVPFGVDVNYFRKIELQKTSDILRVGIVKTLEDKYGIRYLIEAFSILEKKYDNIELLIVGGGSKEIELKNQVKKLKLDNKVIFTGRVKHDEVPSFFNKMDIVVVPSIVDGESFGVAAVEASACEKPVIVSRVGGLPEVVIDGESGLVCEPKDSICLSEKIELLINNPEMRHRFGKAGRQNVLTHYNWESNVDLMISHYRSIL